MKTPLIDKKVRVVPIERDRGFLPKGHDGHFMFTGARARICLPQDPTTKKLVDPLTKEEREYFESDAAGLALKPNDLSIYKKEDNYWARFEVVLDKNGKLLDLNDPMDYITWKVLLANTKLIAPDSKSKLNKASYKFALVDESEEYQSNLGKAELQKKAWSMLGKIEDSPEKMRNFLWLYTENKPAINAKREFLYNQVVKVVNEDMKGFVGLITHPDYETKVFINSCIDAGIIKQLSKTRYNVIPLDTEFNSIKELVIYLQDDVNQANYLILKAQLENSK